MSKDNKESTSIEGYTPLPPEHRKDLANWTIFSINKSRVSPDAKREDVPVEPSDQVDE